MKALLLAKELNELSTSINAIINKKDERVMVVRGGDPVSVEEIEKRLREEAVRMICLALHSNEFFKAYAIDAHLDLGMKSTIVRHAMKSMSEEAIHVLLACNQSIHIESIEALNIALNIKPLNVDYILQFPDDPVLSRATPIHVPISHNGIPIDDTLKESFSKLLEESFSTSSPFRFHDLPEALQVIVDDFYAKHISDLSNITIDKITFLTSLPLTGRKEMDVKLPKDEITCRRLATILPTSHQWLIDRLVIEADALLEAWLNEQFRTRSFIPIQCTLLQQQG